MTLRREYIIPVRDAGVHWYITQPDLAGGHPFIEEDLLATGEAGSLAEAIQQAEAFVESVEEEPGMPMTALRWMDTPDFDSPHIYIFGSPGGGYAWEVYDKSGNECAESDAPLSDPYAALAEARGQL